MDASRLTEQDVAPLWDRHRRELDRDLPLEQCVPGFRGTVVAFANAVLARFWRSYIPPEGIPFNGPCVSKAEARERERAAFALGWQNGAGPVSMRHAEFAAQQNRCFPSLLPKRKTVTLSDGSTWWRGGNVRWWWHRPEIAGDMSGEGPPTCVTAEDFELCAKLLREEETR